MRLIDQWVLRPQPNDSSTATHSKWRRRTSVVRTLQPPGVLLTFDFFAWREDSCYPQIPQISPIGQRSRRRLSAKSVDKSVWLRLRRVCDRLSRCSDRRCDACVTLLGHEAGGVGGTCPHISAPARDPGVVAFLGAGARPPYLYRGVRAFAADAADGRFSPPGVFSMWPSLLRDSSRVAERRRRAGPAVMARHTPRASIGV
jgi:hypothetical protein